MIKDRNPFPSVCGRVCPHPCEAQCRRSLVDAPVAINHVKRFAADWDMAAEQPWMPDGRRAAPARRIAIVGAGPSGLSAAYYARSPATTSRSSSASPMPGGMMRYGIPEYRLPKATLDEEIATITALGVQDRQRQGPRHPPAAGGPAEGLRRRLPGDRLVARHPDGTRGRELRRRLARHPATSSRSPRATTPSSATRRGRHRRRQHRDRLRPHRPAQGRQARRAPLPPHPRRDARRGLRGRGSRGTKASRWSSWPPRPAITRATDGRNAALHAR